MIAALTGSIGCGKSTVLEIFSRLEWFTLSADRICHDLYNSGDLKFNGTIAERWGAGIINADGAADRKKIAAIVFNDRKELDWLNSVLHPIIMDRAGQLIASVNNKFVLFEVPLLYEAGMEGRFESVICVWTSAANQHKRLKERGFDEKDIRLRVNNQLASDVKLEKADYGLINEGCVELLNEQCIILNHQIREEHGRQR